MKVLIVEDDAASREFLLDTVESQGFEVRVATDGLSGLEAFKKFNPDIVLSDIRMPKMDGLEMLKEIRKLDSNVIVVMSTAFGCEEYAIKALHYRANNYLKKPIRHKDLLPLFHKCSSIIKTSDSVDIPEIGSAEVKTHFTLTLQSSVEDIPDMVNLLMKATSGSLDEKEILNTKFGLTELLTNAIENGNLEITSEEWAEAFLTGDKGLKILRGKKMSDPLIARRTVKVTYKSDDEYFEWVISDQGKGFDWQRVLRECDGMSPMDLECKGIFLSRFHFDGMEYMDNGSTVRVRKRRTSIS